MAQSFFFYDLETSGFSPKTARIMQFAGQRTDMELNPVGDPVNVLIKLTPDVLPETDAVLLTGITPQQTLADGMSEAEFLKYFHQQVVQPDTIFIGFNSIRFDDEFMRYLLYRNFYDAYEWQWKDGCSRWDLLDVVRMTRALRPEGIEWPFAADGKPANRLEFLSQVNRLEHGHAHDALSDVNATIALARLIRQKQPELFSYLRENRSKQAIKKLVLSKQPFIYTSGRYGSRYLHTTAAVLLAKHPGQDAALVYDLRFDPTPFAAMELDELVEAWKFTRDPEAVRLPVKTVKYNRCAAVAPLGVIKDAPTQERIGLTLQTITQNFERLKNQRNKLAPKVEQAIARLDSERERAQVNLVDDQTTVDERLYEKFINSADTVTMRAVRSAEPSNLPEFSDSFADPRLQSLLPLYKARNFPKQLTAEERAAWDEFVYKKLLAGNAESRLAKYFARLEALAKDATIDRQKYLLEELRLYGESVMPSEIA